MKLLRVIMLPGFIILLAAVLSGCGGGGGSATRSSMDYPTAPPIYTREEASQRAAWTVLVYMDADNDLESAGIANFNQMEVIGSTRDVHVIVQIDRKTGDDPNNEHWTDTRRYLITRDSDTKVMHSVRLDNPPLGELNMASPSTLGNFVAWGMSEFPADHYCLVIWDHGTGWQFRSESVTPEFKTIATDDTNAWQMNITEIPSALGGRGIDVVAFDACYMQELEIAYELRNCGHYMVASAATEPSPGYNYTRWLSQMNSTTTPEALCRTMVEEYAREYPSPRRSITLSAIDLTRMSELSTALDGFAEVLRSNDSFDWSTIRDESLCYTTGTVPRYSLDLMDYASRCASALHPQADAAYAALSSAYSNAILEELHNSDMPSAHGLGIYVPAPFRYDFRYGQLSLSRNTQWDEWLQQQSQ